MRLINTSTLELKEFFGRDIPPYAILSHRWTDDEIDLEEFVTGSRKESHGHQKIVDFCKWTRSGAHLNWAWADTVCIDKRSSVDLSEAVNSMFKWYQSAAVCLVHLFDVPDPFTCTTETPPGSSCP